jgi:hypothetical protein
MWESRNTGRILAQIAGVQGLRALVIVAVLCAASCSRTDAKLEDHSDAFASLSATTTRIVEAWLSGSVSGTYALTALDQTYVLVEQERSALTARPSMVSDERGAAMSDAAVTLARHIAETISAVRDADGGLARQHLQELPFRKS